MGPTEAPWSPEAQRCQPALPTPSEPRTSGFRGQWEPLMGTRGPPNMALKKKHGSPGGGVKPESRRRGSRCWTLCFSPEFQGFRAYGGGSPALRPARK